MSGIPPFSRSGSTTPAKKAPFRPSGSAQASPTASQITPPKTRIPTIVRSPSASTPASPAHSPHGSTSSIPSIIRNSPQALARKGDNPRGLSGEIAAARSYLHSESQLSSATAMVSQADRRNKLKKRLLIQQTEKIKELLWEKASLLQKKQLLDDEQRETDTIRRKIEDEREERQRAWVMEEAIRREEEEEELKYSSMRLRKYAQRYEFEMAKREKMIRSKEQKEWKRNNHVQEALNESRRKDMERARLANGITRELDDTLSPHSPPPPQPQPQPVSAPAPAHTPIVVAPAPAAAPSPISPASSFSGMSPTPILSAVAAALARRTSEGGMSTASTSSTLSDGEVVRELQAGGFQAKPAAVSPVAAAPAPAPAPASAAPTPAPTSPPAAATAPVPAVPAKTPKANKSEDGLLELEDDSIAKEDGLLDDDDVTFLSSSDDSDSDSEEKEPSQSRRSSGAPTAAKALRRAAAKAEKEAEREERERERERLEAEEKARRDAETAKEREERERREWEEQERKEREWQDLKDRLMNEARELQDRERARLQREREEEQRRVSQTMAAKEAEMNQLIAKLKDAESKGGMPALPALPASADVAPSSSPTAAPPQPAPEAGATSPVAAATTPVAVSGSVTPVKALPPLSSITLRSASASLLRKEEEAAAAAAAPLTATPVRRIVPPPAVSPVRPKPAKKAEVSESVAISSMLHELEQLEEEEGDDAQDGRGRDQGAAHGQAQGGADVAGPQRRGGVGGEVGQQEEEQGRRVAATEGVQGGDGHRRGAVHQGRAPGALRLQAQLLLLTHRTRPLAGRLRHDLQRPGRLDAHHHAPGKAEEAPGSGCRRRRQCGRQWRGQPYRQREQQPPGVSGQQRSRQPAGQRHCGLRRCG